MSEIPKEVLKKSGARVMSFRVGRVAEFLRRNKVVYTVRGYCDVDMRDVWIPELGLFGTRIYIREVFSEADLRMYIKESGFSSLAMWWAVVRRMYGDSKRKHLYQVSIEPVLLDVLHGLKMYLLRHHRRQLKTAIEYLEHSQIKYFVPEDFTFSAVIKGRHGDYVTQADFVKDEISCSCQANRGRGFVCWHSVALVLYLAQNRYINENLAIALFRNYLNKGAPEPQVTINHFI